MWATADRCKTVVEPRLSTQWFVKIQPLADKAKQAVREKHIRFTPEMYEKTYFEWMENIHDWCISRQLWWGHRIPAWHCATCHKITVARVDPTACSHCGSEKISQETDVLDTWFSSGLLPISVFGWPNFNSTSVKDTEFSVKDTDFSVKGTGFSPYINDPREYGALAPEGQNRAVPLVPRTWGPGSCENRADFNAFTRRASSSPASTFSSSGSRA